MYIIIAELLFIVFEITNNACFLTLLNSSFHVILPMVFFVVGIVSPF